MGPKKDAPKAGAEPGVEGEDPVVFLQNYQKYCKYVFVYIIGFKLIKHSVFGCAFVSFLSVCYFF